MENRGGGRERGRGRERKGKSDIQADRDEN